MQMPAATSEHHWLLQLVGDWDFVSECRMGPDQPPSKSTGTLDADRRILTLNAEGPNISGDGTMANYQDIIEVVDQDTYLFSSRLQSADGSWTTFMNGTHVRRKFVIFDSL